MPAKKRSRATSTGGSGSRRTRPASPASRAGWAGRGGSSNSPAALRTRKEVSERRAAPAEGGSVSTLRLARILELLDRFYPEPTTALRWETPLQLLVATILSAQCTDERVNEVTRDLFRAYPSANAFAEADLAALERAIYSTGFYRAKARAIHGCCRLLVEHHGGEVPREMAELVKLPGVARKTANVVLGTAYGIASGIVVDTHVKRVSGRLALTQHKDPEKIERELMRVVERSRWISLGHQLILHGRAICAPRKPRCAECPLAPHCPAAGTISPAQAPI